MADERRWFAIGDPQTTFEKLLDVLRASDLLRGDRLRDDVGLLSIGDHFDFPSERSREEVARDGTTNLRWLASHPPEQVVIMFGNHDAARVMELAFETDESFAAAQAMAKTRSKDDFIAAFPRIPTPDIALRDYSSFVVHQRDAVRELLLAGRFRLATTAHREGTEMLVTHAGVTNREVEILGVTASPSSIARALEERLRAAVDRVRAKWQAGETAALDLSPLHAAGRAGEEGGGLLYHRPSTKPRDAWSSSGPAPRRFDPASLPRDLVQVCGHTGHHKCREELGDVLTAAAKERARGGLRTLSVGPDGTTYDLGIHAPRAGAATMYFIDIEMNRKEVTEHPLLALDRVDVSDNVLRA